MGLLLAIAWFEAPQEIERQARAGKPYAQAFRAVVGALDDAAAARAVRAIEGQDDLVAEDDARRYVVERDVHVGPLCALVVRPRHAAAKLPALLELTIYADWDVLMRFSARMAASRGYAAVIAFVRGKGCSAGQPVPYVTNADDAVTAIDWIAKQPWSDGRVGMFGGSYSGGSAWAAAKRMPKALRTIAVGAPVAPGIDVPMENGIFWNFVYPWPFYVTDEKGLDNAVYGDHERWSRLDRAYYVTGRPLPRARAMGPRRSPARNALRRGQNQSQIDGYPLDEAAKVDLEELRYQWFDYVLKGKPRPALLADRVNYEVIGANQWRHARSLEAMAQTTPSKHRRCKSQPK